MQDKKEDVFNRIAKKGLFPPQLAFTLLIPLRNIILSPKKLVKRLDLKKDYRVLEVGCGPGYFSPKVARTIPNGELVLTDIQREMLRKAKKRLSRKNVSNVEYHLSNGIDFPFKDNEFDCIYMVTVMGEIENQEQYVKAFLRILRPGGIVSISEQAGDPDKMSIKEVKKLFNKFNFKFDKIYGSKRNYTINFVKPD